MVSCFLVGISNRTKRISNRTKKQVQFCELDLFSKSFTLG